MTYHDLPGTLGNRSHGAAIVVLALPCTVPMP
ncbi:exopolysaccharide biosynthesis protein [Pseudaestuariivita atlantica]|nr:exopolysaccharide biosynthesis protein [Pseudaestuariivita atlantica]